MGWTVPEVGGDETVLGASCNHDATRGGSVTFKYRHGLKEYFSGRSTLSLCQYLVTKTLVQISLQHLPTMQAGGSSGEAPLSGPNKMLSGLFAKAHTQATGLLAKVSRVSEITFWRFI